jgi:hypothetical protein
MRKQFQQFLIASGAWAAAMAITLGVITQASHAYGFDITHGRGTQSIDVLHRGLWLSPGEMTSVPLASWMQVQRIFVQAEGYRCNTTVEVYANGDLKGTMVLPGYDPSYAVTIAETTDRIELRNLGPCAASIRDIRAEVYFASNPSNFSPSIPAYSRPPIPGYAPSLSSQALNSAAAIAAEAINVTDGLRAGASGAENTTYLLPIKKVAGRLYAMANARGDLSGTVHMQLLALRAQIDFAAPYLDETFERDTMFELATQLLSLRERIDAITL